MTDAYSSSLKIMVVDDEPANLKVLKKTLNGHGYDSINLISDPRDVVEKYTLDRPDLILLDLNMPYLDGFEVMSLLRDLDDPLLPPIVVLTAQTGKDYVLRALSLGARDFISKPFDRTELLMRVRNLLDAQLAHRLIHDQKAELEQMVRWRTEELAATRLEVVRRLGMAAEYRDEETGSHIVRMSRICATLARGAGWNEEMCMLILHASPMHDLGKIGIPDAVLLKPGKLDSAEWEIMKSHAQVGANLLDGNDSSLMEMSREIALTHHEKWDGSGYPNGLSGEDIPESGRIAALADVFDALTSERPYKKAWSIESALKLIREQRGQHFDPRLVDVFFNALDEILEIKTGIEH
ncbi:HD domain-containing phosphohydrolase [Nisaea sp.]|uniref:HD domain-containing phosphohydrolase n=1 Tax=Nisaea sp. TaxID=2024842 RepID=UPI002B278A31|nr:HD domain-containing phosphohydrolase [Nisaea sp.]